MIFSLDDLRPGSIVEHDGQLILIEDLRFRLVGQCITSYQDLITRVENGETIAAPSPMFMTLEGGIDDAVWDKTIPYQPKEPNE